MKVHMLNSCFSVWTHEYISKTIYWSENADKFMWLVHICDKTICLWWHMQLTFFLWNWYVFDLFRLTIEASAWCQLILLSTFVGKRSTVFSKDCLDSLLTSTHLTDLRRKLLLWNLEVLQLKLRELIESALKPTLSNLIDLVDSKV